ncbi:MAG: serine hydrolase [Desulfobulbaceae bacterium]|nr:serine hydrolase [Desulfobulbaceae bacterium]
MRVVVSRLFILVSLFFLLIPGADVQAKGRHRGKQQAQVLSSRHKHAPQGHEAERARAVDEGRMIHLVSPAKEKEKPVAVAASVDDGKFQQAALALGKKISAKSAIIIDGVTGEPLFELSPDLPRQPASTIKVLTGLLSIGALDNSDMVSASRRAAGQPRSKIYLQPGKSYTADDMINAVLLASANDASVALAERVAGSEQRFAAMMTGKARSLGARNTICQTATGLTAAGQQSTARDLAVIFNRAMANDEFARRVSRSTVKTCFGKLLRNHNKALWQVDGAEGGKTGYTDVARQTYVGKFKREQGEVVVALMGSETMWSDVKTLVEFGFAQKRRLGTLARAGKGASAKVAPSVEAQIAAIRNFYASEVPQSGSRVLADNKKVSKL